LADGTMLLLVGRNGGGTKMPDFSDDELHADVTPTNHRTFDWMETEEARKYFEGEED